METRADKLYRLLEDENNARELLKIPQDTYQEIASFIKTIRVESSEREKSLSSELASAERKILCDIASRLLGLRVQKFNDDPDADVANLTLEERYIVDPLTQSRKRLERVSECIFNGQAGELLHLASSIKQKYVYARFLQPYASISGIDMSTYGPFEAEDVAILPLENAVMLLKNGIIAKTWVEPESL